MLIALFTVMSMAANAEVIVYSTDDGFKYNLDTAPQPSFSMGLYSNAPF